MSSRGRRDGKPEPPGIEVSGPRTSPKPSTKRPAVSLAQRQQIQDSVQAAFKKNVPTEIARREAQEKSERPMADPAVIYREGDQPEAVTPETPLEGLETEVLRVWMETPTVRKAHQRNPEVVEAAARRAVFDAVNQEAILKAQGLQPLEAQEFTRPAMWMPPHFATASLAKPAAAGRHVREAVHRRRGDGVEEGRAQSPTKQEPPIESPLGALGAQILNHWTEHRPKMTARLKAAGKLETAAYAAEQLTLEAEALAVYDGMALDQARELYRETWAFLPIEEDVPSLPNGDPAEWCAPASPDTVVSSPSPKKLLQ